MKYYCEYCKKHIELKNYQTFGGHKATCKYNPNFKEGNKRRSQTLKNLRGVKMYNLICAKCGKEYEIEMTEHFYRNKLYRKHCSYTCSNSRVQTDDMNKSRSIKVSETMRKSYRDGTREIPHNDRTKWYIYKDINVQGTYELRACKILDKWKSLGKIKDWEYTKDKFPYIGLDGKQHTYFIDFKVFNQDGTFYYVETKGYEREIDSIKWSALRDTGNTLKVWKIKDIKEREEDLNLGV